MPSGECHQRAGLIGYAFLLPIALFKPPLLTVVGYLAGTEIGRRFVTPDLDHHVRTQPKRNTFLFFGPLFGLLASRRADRLSGRTKHRGPLHTPVIGFVLLFLWAYWLLIPFLARIVPDGA